MLNFIYQVPTKIYFGKGQIKHLTTALREAGGTRVLLVYGGGSIKRTGVYQTITQMFQQENIQWRELSGITPNPLIEDVRRGAQLCKEEQIDLVLAVGGGSSIDAAKAIAVAACSAEDAWDLVIRPQKITQALPIISVLTLAATGSEMNAVAVITNNATGDKIGTRHELMRPQASILDPEYTFSVSPKQTASGVADIMAHVFENYFSRCDSGFVQDEFAEGLLRTCIKYGPIAYTQPDNYEARANLMWAGSWAINGILALGKADAWCCHSLDHQLGAQYDITHGEGLAVVYPHWMEYVLSENTVDRFYRWGVNVWNIHPQQDKMQVAKQAIQCLREFWQSLNLPGKLTDLHIGEEKFEIMADKAANKMLLNAYVPLEKQDVLKIFQSML